MEKMLESMRRAKKKIKGWILTLLSFDLMISGFVGEEAKSWVRLIYSALRERKYSISQVVRAAKCGFTPRQLERLGLTGESCREDRKSVV